MTLDVSMPLDLRQIAPPSRHALVFGSFAALQPGEAFELVNDHDPAPLRQQFEMRSPGLFSWRYLESGPEVRRRLILMVRETPLNLAHLRNMTSVTEMGGIIFPPMPSFYHRPQSLAEMVDHTVSRVIDMLGLPQTEAPRWQGLNMASQT